MRGRVEEVLQLVVEHGHLAGCTCEAKAKEALRSGSSAIQIHILSGECPCRGRR